MKKLLAVLGAAALMVLGAGFAHSEAAALQSFKMPEAAGATKEDMQVHYYKPASWTPGRPIVAVFHGLKRNAADYCKGWADYAEKHNFLVVCPEFTEKKYPGVRYYNLGNVLDRDGNGGKVMPKNKWVFSTVDDIIKATRKEFKAGKSPFVLYAHSAGAQMMHRYVLLGGKTEADLIIAANSGWYTMPDREIPYSYGLKSIPVSDKALQAALHKPVVIMLGEEDVKRTGVLRKTPEADAQGMNRLERGQNFFAAAQTLATSLKTTCSWKLVTVPGVGHDGVGMAKGAMPLIEALAR